MFRSKEQQECVGRISGQICSDNTITDFFNLFYDAVRYITRDAGMIGLELSTIWDYLSLLTFTF